MYFLHATFHFASSARLCVCVCVCVLIMCWVQFSVATELS